MLFRQVVACNEQRLVAKVLVVGLGHTQVLAARLLALDPKAATKILGHAVHAVEETTGTPAATELLGACFSVPTQLLLQICVHAHSARSRTSSKFRRNRIERVT